MLLNMAHGVGEVLGEGNSSVKIVSTHQPSQNHNQTRKPVGVMGSRRIFAAAFKLKVLDSYRNDIDCRGNQRATARKYGIHRRQIQKWLQCEDNLRSCAENPNNSGVIMTTGGPTPSDRNTNVTVTSSVVTKTMVPSVVTKSSGMTPAAPAQPAPALNLSLARLHGDDVASQQGPPPSHSSSHQRCGDSPIPAQYNQQSSSSNSMPVRGLLIGYTEYSNQQELHHQRTHQQSEESIHSYQIERTGSPSERKFYVLSHPYEQTVPGYRGGNDVSLYHHNQQQNLAATSAVYQAKSGHGYNGIVGRDHRILGTTGFHQSSGHVQIPPHSHRRDVDSPGNELLAPTIKTERASPDSPATPGPCREPSSSPGITTTTSPGNVYPVSQYIRSATNGIATQAVAVHFEVPRRSPEAHVHISIDAHTLDSKNQQQKQIDIVYVKQEGENKITVKDELSGVLKMKEELIEEQNELYNMNQEDRGSNYNGDIASDYRTPPVPLSRSTSDVQSRGTLSPTRESHFSGPLSPKGTTSISSRSTSSSCSDSEIDSHDFPSRLHQHVVSDLSRRRSFSLRFKLDVLDAFHNDIGVAGNQRATARKYGINRRQVQKWLGQETELRGEIALRGGDMRQRLGPLQEVPGESPVDLRTVSDGSCEVELDQSPSPHYCCDSSSQRSGFYSSNLIDSEVPQKICNLSCCSDNLTTSSMNSYYPESRRMCYMESQGSFYCYSPRDSENIVPEIIELPSSPLKRTSCTLSCCYDGLPSPKRLCVESPDDEKDRVMPPQETPLCLVKPKRSYETSPIHEPVTSTVPTPPAQTIATALAKKDAILFKPYLDNPISKPSDDSNHHRNHSPLGSQSVIVNNNNNNCHSICNLNEERINDYAVELNLRVPTSWRPPHIGYTEIPERIRSAFARYPTSQHYA